MARVTAPADIPCFTCDITAEYVDLAGSFTDALSQVLIGPMWAVFLSLAALWIAIHGIKMMLGMADIAGFAKEFVYVVIAAGLLGGQGSGLVKQTYEASLAVMGSGASVALSVGDASGVEASPEGAAGMTQLVRVAETGVFQVFQMGAAMAAQTGFSDPLAPLIYALLLVIPYFLLLIVYFAQVVVSIFRVMMLAAVSPILMMCFGFGWGRGMAYAGLKTLFASFMVLFGSTIALAVCLYGVKSLGIADPSVGAEIKETLTFTNPKLLVAISLGWLGTAFLAEATSIANSVTHAQLSNQAAAMISAGMTATGLSMIAKPMQNLGRNASPLGGDLIDRLRGRLSGDDGGGSGGGGSRSPQEQAIKERLNTPTVDNSPPAPPAPPAQNKT